MVPPEPGGDGNRVGAGPAEGTGPAKGEPARTPDAASDAASTNGGTGTPRPWNAPYPAEDPGDEGDDPPRSAHEASDYRTDRERLLGKRARLLSLGVAALVAVAWGVAVVVLHVQSSVGLLPAMVVAAIPVASLYLPVFTVEGEAVLETGKSIDRVREDYTGPFHPSASLLRTRAATIRPREDGATYVTESLLGTETEFEAESTVASDRRIESTLSAGGEPYSRFEVELEPTDEGTRVHVDMEYESRFRPRALLVMQLQTRYAHRILRERGYEVRLDEGSVGI